MLWVTRYRQNSGNVWLTSNYTLAELSNNIRLVEIDSGRPTAGEAPAAAEKLIQREPSNTASYFPVIAEDY